MGVVYDYIGIGFGPSNLAMAIATQEYASQHGLNPTYCFVERKPAFSWHEGMLIEDSTMQIAFLKDLATLRDPTSHFTFINYLKEKGRLEDFINLQTFFPTREEFNDYLRWAASSFDDRTHYGESVENVEPCFENGALTAVEVVSRDADDNVNRRRARNIVVGVGGKPQLPPAFEGVDDRRIVHSSRYMDKIEDLMSERDQPMRVAIVGAGQSAAEIFYDIHSRFDNAEASLVVRGGALKPSDDSPFVNEIFNTSFTDEIYGQRDDFRQQLLSEFRNTNYSVVDLDLIERIYHIFYLQKVRGEGRHRFLANRDVVGVKPQREHIELTLRDKRDAGLDTAQFDLVVLATGYRHDAHRDLLAGLDECIDTLAVDRRYRIGLSQPDGPGVFLQGCCEGTHGISDSLLSVLPVRSQEVVESIFAEAQAQPASEARWAAPVSPIR